MAFKEFRRADDGVGFSGRQPHRDHIHLNEVTKSESGVELLLDDVDQTVVAHQLQLHVRVEIDEARQQPVDQ